MTYRQCYLIAGFLCSSAFLCGQNANSFSGLWRQDLTESLPKRKSGISKQLNIKLEGDTLIVILSGPGKIHQVEVTYQVGGPEVTYTGLDGDKFRMKVRHEGDSLLFEGKELEDGREHAVRETWTLQQKAEGQVLIDTKNAKDPNEPSLTKSEYERVKE